MNTLFDDRGSVAAATAEYVKPMILGWGGVDTQRSICPRIGHGLTTVDGPSFPLSGEDGQAKLRERSALSSVGFSLDPSLPRVRFSFVSFGPDRHPSRGWVPFSRKATPRFPVYLGGASGPDWSFWPPKMGCRTFSWATPTGAVEAV